jgi:hypothetical protein
MGYFETKQLNIFTYNMFCCCGKPVEKYGYDNKNCRKEFLQSGIILVEAGSYQH